MLDVLAGAMPGDPYVGHASGSPLAREVGDDPGRLRIGCAPPRRAASPTSTPVASPWPRRRRALLESCGHDVEEEAPAAIDEIELVVNFLTILAEHSATWPASGRSPG